MVVYIFFYNKDLHSFTLPLVLGINPYTSLLRNYGSIAVKLVYVLYTSWVPTLNCLVLSLNPLSSKSHCSWHLVFKKKHILNSYVGIWMAMNYLVILTDAATLRRIQDYITWHLTLVPTFSNNPASSVTKMKAISVHFVGALGSRAQIPSWQLILWLT